MLLGIWVFLSLVVAAILEGYKIEHFADIMKDRLEIVRVLGEAFRYLDIQQEGLIRYEVWHTLLRKLAPDYDDEQVHDHFPAAAHMHLLHPTCCLLLVTVFNAAESVLLIPNNLCK